MNREAKSILSIAVGIAAILIAINSGAISVPRVVVMATILSVILHHFRTARKRV
jgi:hypothetical protein